MKPRDYLMDGSHLGPASLEREQLLNLLKRYSDIFAENRQDVGRMNKVTHQISIGTSPPIRQPVRRVPPAKREDTRKLLLSLREVSLRQSHLLL